MQWPENDIKKVQDNLRQLNISNNKLTSISSSVGELAAIVTLNVSENTISKRTAVVNTHKI